MSSTAYVAVAVTIFAVVSFNFLFPCNCLLPLGKIVFSLLDHRYCSIFRMLFSGSNSLSDCVNALCLKPCCATLSEQIVERLVLSARWHVT